MSRPRRIVITSALPYANADLHIGNMLEHITTDFWARFQRMRGHECLAICAEDTHGAPIVIKARKQGTTPEALIAKMHTRHLEDLKQFDIHYDHFSSTHTKHHESFCQQFYHAMTNKGYVTQKAVQQFYCEHDKMFLPDRFVKGTCPKCKAPDQYGDNCDKCGAVYDPTDITEPKCATCNQTPVEKESTHFFVSLNQFTDYLKTWVPEHTSSAVNNKLQEWLTSGLKDWCLSRDEPYFGFPIPNSDQKYFYVWFDAPIGYLSATSEWCEKNNRSVDEFWKDPDSEIYHNIGKDIIYFHSLFWPIMLKTSGWKTPSQIFVHGMLTVDGVKLSKSKGSFINARTYLKHLPSDYLRYYFACKCSDSIADIDLNMDDFASRVNSDLVGKITNIASRSFQLLQKHLDGKLGTLPEDGKTLIQTIQSKAEIIATYYEQRQNAKAMVQIRELADAVNKYVDDYTPWKLIKEDPEKTRQVLTTALNGFRLISLYLKPVLPSYVKKVEHLFNDKPYTWHDSQSIIENQETTTFKHLLPRLQIKHIKAMMDDTKAGQASSKNTTQAIKKESKTMTSPITIEDFLKVDLRVAKVVKAENIEKANKLLKLTLDVGELGTRTVFAGIKTAYTADQLLNQLVVVVANLQPRKMTFGTSEGMILAAGPGGQDLWLVHPAQGAHPGMRIS